MERYRAESPLQKATRRLREVEEHIAALRGFIVHLRSIGHDSAPLERLLEVFSHSRELALQRLAIEQKIAESWRKLVLMPFRRSAGRRSDDDGDA